MSWPVTNHRQPHSFKTRLLGGGFHTLIRTTSFPSPTNVRSQLLLRFKTMRLTMTIRNGSKLKSCYTRLNQIFYGAFDGKGLKRYR